MSEQQKTKLKIEDIIAGLLDGEMKKNALDFIAYLRETKMAVSRASGNAETKRIDGAWKANYKGKGICRIWLSKNHWIVCPYIDYTKDFEAYIANEKLQDIIWDNLFICRKCNPRLCSSQANKAEETFTGFNKTYFGKEFENICKFWDAYFQNPDGRTIACIKRIMEFKKNVE